jgi:hypothetical protein
LNLTFPNYYIQRSAIVLHLYFKELYIHFIDSEFPHCVIAIYRHGGKY